MKKVFLVLVSAALLAACQNADTKTGSTLSKAETDKAMDDTARFTTVEWLDSTTRDFGKIKNGEVLEVAFHFRNTGQYPLTIANVSPGCGCTTSETPKEPVLPGKEGVIKAKFDSKGRVGKQNKYINVVANTKPNSTMTLNFSVEVTE